MLKLKCLSARTLKLKCLSARTHSANMALPGQVLKAFGVLAAASELCFEVSRQTALALVASRPASLNALHTADDD